MEEIKIKNKAFKPKNIIKTIINYFFLIGLLVFFLFPLFIMVSRSLMTNDEINFFPKLFSSSPSFKAYGEIFNAKIIYWFLNTIILVLVNIVGTTVSSSLCAYGFSKLKFKGRELIFAITLATLMLPAITMQIPLYIIFSKLGWVGTWYPMTVPSFFGGGAMTIFLMRQFMKGIPDQLLEAAKIDGAGKMTIYARMVIPMSMPIVALTMVNVFLGVWNDFTTPLMYLGAKESMFTISMGLYWQFRMTPGSPYFANAQMAAGVMMLIPCMIVFFIFQNQLINGVTMSGIKG